MKVNSTYTRSNFTKSLSLNILKQKPIPVILYIFHMQRDGLFPLLSLKTDPNGTFIIKTHYFT